MQNTVVVGGGFWGKKWKMKVKWKEFESKVKGENGIKNGVKRLKNASFCVTITKTNKFR